MRHSCRRLLILHFVLILLVSVVTLTADADDVSRVRDAIKRSTLDQLGTKPFHLKAALAPSHDRDRDSGRTGEVEIWWASPTRYKREVRSPEFHQIEIVDGDKRWQKNEGNYFPEWLRNIAVELIRPVPDLDGALKGVAEADVKRLMGSTYYSWQWMSTDGKVQKGIGGSIAITDSTGLLFYGGAAGWNGLFHDYQKFQGRMVARTVSAGTPEVSAKIQTLEDLGQVSDALFATDAPGGDSQPIDTVLVDELTMRKNLITPLSITWPALRDGPLEGVLTTHIVVDRNGTVREVGHVASDNPALEDPTQDAIAKLQFKPYLQNGIPVQVITRLTMPFKTTGPAGTETFESARTYFERGRKLNFLAASATSPYLLKADYQAQTSSGIQKGDYEDTWFSDTRWRREARIGSSRFVRSRDGDKWYQLAEGPDTQLLRLVLKFMEPLPAIDTFTESDWKVRRVGADLIRVLAGYESPDGKLDPQQSRAYWFNNAGDLVKTYYRGLETLRLDPDTYAGVNVARTINVYKGGALGMTIRVTGIAPPPSVEAKFFELSGHKWQRAFTDEAR